MAIPLCKSVPTPAADSHIVTVRIWDWSEWCRQVVRGIQRFAHERPGWRLYVDAGQTTRPQVYSDDMRLDGIIAHVMSDVRGWRRLPGRQATSC